MGAPYLASLCDDHYLRMGMPLTCEPPARPLQGVMLGVESGSVQKFAGIILSVAGSICMVRTPLLHGANH